MVSKHFDKLVAALTEKRVPCRVKLSSFSWGENIAVETGWDTPDDITDKVLTTFEELGMNHDDNISCCAESSGGTTVKSQRIAGGPENYRAKKYGDANQLIKMLSRGRY
jgi:hypothetical protein